MRLRNVAKTGCVSTIHLSGCGYPELNGFETIILGNDYHQQSSPRTTTSPVRAAWNHVTALVACMRDTVGEWDRA